MKRGIIVAIALLMVCFVASVALADVYLVETSGTIGRAELSGNSNGISSKVSASTQGDTFLFNIHTALDDADWQVDSDNEKYLGLQMYYSIPSSVREDDTITQYIVQFKNGANGEWLYPRNNTDTTPHTLIGQDNTKFATFGTGNRYDKREYDRHNSFYLGVRYTWLNAEGQQVGESSAFSVCVMLGYYPSTVPASRLTADDAEGITPNVIDGSASYRLSGTFAGTGIKTLVTPPAYASATDCSVYADDSYTALASGVSTGTEGGKLALTAATPASATDLSTYPCYLSWNTAAGALKELVNITVVPADYSDNTVAHFENDQITFRGVPNGTIMLTNQANVDVSDTATPNESSESRTAVPYFNIATYNTTSAEAWFELHRNSPSPQEVLFGLCFAMPDTAVEYTLVGTNINASDEYVRFTLDNYGSVAENRRRVERNGSSRYIEHLEPLATVSADDGSLQYVPVERKMTTCIKWWDTLGLAHYSRADIWVKPQNAGETEKTYSYNGGLIDSLRINAYSSPASQVSYADGTITYMLNGSYTSGIELSVDVLRPDDSRIHSVMCDGDGYTLDGDGKITLGIGLEADACTSARKGSWRLDWLDEGRERVKTELLYWQTDPVTQEYWMKREFSPVPASRSKLIGVSASNRRLFTYDAEDGAWYFEIPIGADPSTLDLDALTEFGLDYPAITPPAGAVSCRIDYWEINLYGNDPDIITESFASQRESGEEPWFVSELDGGAARLRYGRYCDKTLLAGTNIELYSVRDTRSGSGDMMFVQWYNAQGDPIRLESGRTIEYMMQIVRPYNARRDVATVDASNSAALSAAAAGGVPFATVNGVNGVFYLRSEGLIATGITTAAGQHYQLRDLQLVDAFGNDVTLPAGSNVTIYWPYPSGVTYVNNQSIMQQKYNITVDHYTGSNVLTPDRVTLTYTPYGASYTVTTFSPFLIRYNANAIDPNNPNNPHVPVLADPSNPDVPVTGGQDVLGFVLIAAGAAPAMILRRRRRA